MLSPVLVTLSHTAIEKSRKLRMKYPSIVKRAEQGHCCIRYNSIGTCLNYAQEQYGVSGQDIFPHREEDEIHVPEGHECEGIRLPSTINNANEGALAYKIARKYFFIGEIL